jgi:hypothetical protein
VFEFVVVVDRGVLCSPRFHGVVTLHLKELQPIHGDRDGRACHHLLPVGHVLHLPPSLHGAAAGQARRVCTSSDGRRRRVHACDGNDAEAPAAGSILYVKGRGEQ